MSNFVAAANALRARLNGYAALPKYWPNDERPAPSFETCPGGFVYSEIRLRDERQISLGLDGGRCHRDSGELAVYVYVPRGSRVGEAEDHAEAIRALFKPTAVADVVVTRRTIGAGEQVSAVNGADGAAYCVPVFVSWFSDRTE